MQHVHPVHPNHMLRLNADFIMSHLWLDRHKIRHEWAIAGSCDCMLCVSCTDSAVCNHECCGSAAVKALKTLLVVLDVWTWSRHEKKQMDNFNKHSDFLYFLTYNGVDYNHFLNGRNCLKHSSNVYFSCPFLDSFSLLFL